MANRLNLKYYLLIRLSLHGKDAYYGTPLKFFILLLNQLTNSCLFKQRIEVYLTAAVFFELTKEF